MDIRKYKEADVIKPCKHGNLWSCGLCMSEQAPKCEHGIAFYCGFCGGPVVPRGDPEYSPRKHSPFSKPPEPPFGALACTCRDCGTRMEVNNSADFAYLLTGWRHEPCRNSKNCGAIHHHSIFWTRTETSP